VWAAAFFCAAMGWSLSGFGWYCLACFSSRFQLSLSAHCDSCLISSRVEQMTIDSVFERFTSIPLDAFATKRSERSFADRVRLLHWTKETPPEHPTTTASYESLSDRDAWVVDPHGDAWTGD
ncbi:MAG: hypothetical protein ACKOD2_19015, partial [Ilumatobacteraceae bacterium]